MAINKRGIKTFQAGKDAAMDHNRSQHAQQEAFRRFQVDVSEELEASIAETLAEAIADALDAIADAIAALPAAPTAASLEVEFGAFGRYSQDGRQWGVDTRVDCASSATEAFGMVAGAGIAGTSVETPTSAQPRSWSFDAAGLVAGNYGGFRQGTLGLAAWVQCPRMQTLIQISDRADNVITNRRVWVALTSAVANNNANANALADVSSSNTLFYVGLRYDSAVSPNWYVCTSDGTTASETTTGIPVVIGTDYNIDLNLTTPTSLVVTVNGVATTKTTNLPAATSILRTKWMTTITRLSADGLACELRWHHVMVSRK